MIERQSIVRVEEGLHARPAAELAKIAKSFTATLEITKGDKSAPARSTVKIMLLGVKEGETISIRAEGEDEAQALESLCAFIEGHTAPTLQATAPVNEPAPTPPSPTLPLPESITRIKGVSGCDGYAVGPVFKFFPATINPERPPIAAAAVPESLAQFRAAHAQVIASLQSESAKAALETREIVAALIDIARDSEIIADIEQRISQLADPVSAVLKSGAAFSASFAAMDSAYFRTRAEDLTALARRIAETLLGLAPADFSAITQPSIIAASTLSALEFAKLDTSKIAGLVICEGGPTSHIAIMARTHGIPAVLGAHDTAALKQATTLAVNGTEGYAVADPDSDTSAIFAARIEAERVAATALDAYRHIHPHTKSGRAIEVAANIGSLAEIGPALANGAMGVGLFRTEFLFMERRTLPSEDEQYAVYAQAAEAFTGRPVVIRTLDVGGDKPIAGIDAPREENPFLGWRGIRMCLDKPELFKPQLRALLRAGAHGNVKIMFPMISVVGELTAARALLHACADELKAEGKAYGKPEIGVMIETPAAVMCAEEIAAEADFFSIGTNDLTQYTMAADRGHPKLAELNRADQPAVVRMMKLACEAANRAGKWVGVCGEAAGKPELIPTLLSFGVSELSMSPALIPRAKMIVTQC